MKNGSVRSKQQNPASFEQWKELSHLSDNGIPCPPHLSARAAQMLIGKPSQFKEHISNLIKRAEVFAPWSEFYKELLGIECSCFDPQFPEEDGKFDKLLVMRGTGPVSSSIEIAKKVGYKVNVSVDLKGPAGETRFGWGWNDYAIWTRSEGGLSAEQLYEKSMLFTDVSETLILMAQYHFETGVHMGLGSYIICSVTGRYVSPTFIPKTHVVGVTIGQEKGQDNPTIYIDHVPISNALVRHIRVPG